MSDMYVNSDEFWGGPEGGYPAYSGAPRKVKYIHLVQEPMSGQLVPSGSRFAGASPSQAAKKLINRVGQLGQPMQVILMNPQTGQVHPYIGWIQPLMEHERTPWCQQKNIWHKAVVKPFNQ